MARCEQLLMSNEAPGSGHQPPWAERPNQGREVHPGHTGALENGTANWSATDDHKVLTAAPTHTGSYTGHGVSSGEGVPVETGMQTLPMPTTTLASAAHDDEPPRVARARDKCGQHMGRRGCSGSVDPGASSKLAPPDGAGWRGIDRGWTNGFCLGRPTP